MRNPAERDQLVVCLWMAPAWLLNSHLVVGVLAQRDLVVVALRMAPALLLNSYLDVDGLELVVEVL